MHFRKIIKGGNNTVRGGGGGGGGAGGRRRGQMPLPHSDETLLIFANVGTYMHVCMYNQPHINNTHMNQTTLQDTSGSYQGR